MHNFLENYLSADIFKQTYKNWRADRTLRLGAGIAYYGIFALIPLIIMMVSFSLLFFDQHEVTQVFEKVFEAAFGDSVSTSDEFIAEVLTIKDSYNRFDTFEIFGLASHVISASFIFLAYKDALDAIWKGSIPKGFKYWIKNYFIAYLVVFISSSVLLGLLIINSVSSLAKYLIPGEDTIFDGVADLIIMMFTLVLGVFLLALINRILIYKKIPWIHLVKGSVFTIVLIIFGTSALSFYLSNFAYNSLYGALGAVFLVLIWIYYQAQIILIGAQYTKVLYDRNSKKK
jgi:membrane protein